jgi:hypothetical protein
LADRILIMKEGEIAREIADPAEIADVAALESWL